VNTKHSRRNFLQIAGTAGVVAAVKAPGLTLATPSRTPRSRWQPDGAGSLARVGVLTPDFDPVPESEMWAMAPHGVSFHAARVTWQWNHDPREFAEAAQVNNAVDQLVALKPRAIVYAFTSSSYALGAEAEGVLRARLEKRAGGVPVILTCMAAAEAFRIIGAHRVALIHPPWFSKEANAQGKDYFQNQGFEIVFCARIAPERPFTEVPPTEVYEWVTTNVPHKAEVVFIGGNGLRAVGTIQALEGSLGRPVLTANQVVFWKLLQVVSATAKPIQYGRIFAKSQGTV
jgi:maleate isomerase